MRLSQKQHAALLAGAASSNDEASSPSAAPTSGAGTTTTVASGGASATHHQGQFILTLDNIKPELKDSETITVTIPPAQENQSPPHNLPYTIGKCMLAALYS